MLVCVIASVAAGACFALGAVLQQGEASGRPASDTMSVRLVADLARNRRWLAGIGLAALSYGCQSLALAFGPLSLVQPLMATEVLFAVPISVRRHGMRAGPREVVGSLAVAGGLALAIVFTRPHGGDPGAAFSRFFPALVVVTALAAAAVSAARCTRDQARAGLLGFAAASVVALQSAFLDATIRQFHGSVLAPFASWQAYALIAAAMVGLVLVQSAFLAAPLAVSLPIINVTEPAVAIGLGVSVFGEQPRTDGAALAATTVGLALLFAGIVALRASPLVRRLHQTVVPPSWPADAVGEGLSRDVHAALGVG